MGKWIDVNDWFYRYDKIYNLVGNKLPIVGNIKMARKLKHGIIFGEKKEKIRYLNKCINKKNNIKETVDHMMSRVKA